jgi:uncharacterized protein (TIGR03437 family)
MTETQDRRAFLLSLSFSAGCTSAIASSLLESASPLLTRKQFDVPTADEVGNIGFRFTTTCKQSIVDIGGGQSLAFSLIPAGVFEMGGDEAPVSLSLEKSLPVRNVRIKSFFMGETPVTRGIWRRILQLPAIAMSLPEPTDIPGNTGAEKNLPIDFLLFAHVEEAIQRLRAATGLPFRLPSEAEWEYTCRAGATTRFNFGDVISRKFANYNNGVDRPLGLTEVGVLNAPNRFGLQDMHGNVLEYCSDWVHSSYLGAPSDGTSWIGTGDSTSRIVRGGSYVFGPNNASSAARYPVSTNTRFSGLGFRLALDSSLSISDPIVFPGGIVDAANGRSAITAPGSVISIYGDQIGPSLGQSSTLDSSGIYGGAISDTRVMIQGRPAPLLYAATTQINAIVPYGTSPDAFVDVVVYKDEQASLPRKIAVAKSAPSFLTLDGSGNGLVAGLLEDGSVMELGKPARRGSVISLFAIGAGSMSQRFEDGQVAGASLAFPLLPVFVELAGRATKVLYAGSAPGLVSSVLQLNIEVPTDLPTGLSPVFLKVGDKTNQASTRIICS